MKYNYKKGSSRPPSCTTTRNQLFKGLLSIQLLSSLRSNKIVVNIDEWSFERSVKQNYSWLPIGKNWSILHEPIEGKWSLILASFSNGEWFAFLKKGTVNSKFFLLFLEILESLILWNWDNPTEKYLLLLDNSSIHSSKLLKMILGSSQLEVRFLTAYTPELAPVELVFRAVKVKLKKQIVGIKTDFSKVKSMKAIVETIEQVKASTWMEWWESVIKKSRLWILDVLDLINQNNSRSREEQAEHIN